MRVLIAPVERIRRPGAAVALERFLAMGAIPDCERCGEPRVVVSEERVGAFLPVFELASRCTGCGLIFHVRRAFDQLD